jgi:hypothetical protein
MSQGGWKGPVLVDDSRKPSRTVQRAVSAGRALRRMRSLRWVRTGQLLDDHARAVPRMRAEILGRPTLEMQSVGELWMVCVRDKASRSQLPVTPANKGCASSLDAVRQ